MTYTAFFGDLFISLSPVVALFFLVVIRDHRLTILTIGGAFFWMLGILLSSMWWYIVAPMQGKAWFALLFSVAIQEAVRAAFVYLYMWVERRIEELRHDKEFPNRLLVSFSTGVGTANAYVLVMYLPVMWEAKGAATLFSSACPSSSLFSINAVLALEFSLLHVLMMVVAFEAYAERRVWLMITLFLTHYAASMLTLINSESGSCVASILSVLGVLLGLFGLVLLLLKTSKLFVRRPRV
eukprot:m51a1_g564 hypothetical protein (239) ;mRNA; f:501483-502679